MVLKKNGTQPSAAPLIDKEGFYYYQTGMWKNIFLGRAINSTLLCLISDMTSQHTTPTEVTMRQTNQLLDYIATQEDAVITHTSSNMKLEVHSNASSLSKPKDRIRAGGHFSLSNKVTIPQNNGAILNIAHIIKYIMSTATEAKLAALYIMTRQAVYIRIILEEMGHKQLPPPLQTENATEDAVYNRNIKPKQTKAMDIRFHWLRDR